MSRQTGQAWGQVKKKKKGCEDGKPGQQEQVEMGLGTKDFQV